MYRVVVPAKRKVTVTVRAHDLALDLWSPLAKTVWTGSNGRLAVSDRTTKTETLALINRSKRAVVFYAHVQLSRKARVLGRQLHARGSHHEVGSGRAGQVSRLGAVQEVYKVLPPDPHRFAGDKDGIGCET